MFLFIYEIENNIVLTSFFEIRPKGAEKQLYKVNVMGGMQPNTDAAIAFSLRWSLELPINTIAVY